MSKTKQGLAPLVSPVSKKQFLAAHWPDQYLLVEGHKATRFVSLLGIPELRDFRSIEPVWHHEAFVLPAHGGDEYLGAPVRGPAIRRLYESGLPMFLHRPERQFTQLTAWIDRLRWDLGVPAKAYLKCSAYATPGATTTSLHFDDAATFILQMSGAKRWWVAPNRSVLHPPGRYSTAMPGGSGHLVELQAAPFPTSMPADAIEIMLRAGSLLFVPAGWWHATESRDESFALMFVVESVSWADVVVRALRTRLLADAEWRRPAIGARSPNSCFREAAAREASIRIGELQSAVSQLTNDEVISTRYIRAPEVKSWTNGRAVAFVSRAWESRITLGPMERRVFKTIDCRLRPFTADDIATSGFDRHVVMAVLAALVEVGYLLAE